MDDLQRLAAEYRRTAALVRLQVRRLEALAAAQDERSKNFDYKMRRRRELLVEMWQDLRGTAAVLSHYYDGRGISAPGSLWFEESDDDDR